MFHFKCTTVLRTLPKEVVSGVLKVLSVAASALQEKKAAIARAMSSALSTPVRVLRVERGANWKESEVHFAADAADGRATEQTLQHESFVTRVAKFFGKEKIKVPEAALKVADVSRRALDTVDLHLDWKFPGPNYYKADYLDGSCLTYAQDTRREFVDYQHMEGTGITHSGDVMREGAGRHEIRVRLDEVEQCVTELYFVLSAYNCQDLSRFSAPSVRLFDPQTPEAQLCEYKAASADSALVMAALQRHGDSWRVIAVGRPCDGTVRDYTPIYAAIAPFQEHYARHRRRYWLVRLYALSTQGRMVTRMRCAHEAQLLERLFDETPEDLFRRLVKFF